MPSAEDDRRGLSAAQAGIWFAQQLDPHSPVFKVGEYVLIEGPVDPVLFEAAVRRAVGEIDALSTRFTDTESGPGQEFAALPDWPFPVLDLSGAADPDAAALDWMRTELSRPFDLTALPLFAQALLRLGPGRHAWYLAYHHIVMDGQGGVVIVRRVAEIYSALVAGTPVPDPAIPSVRVLLDQDTAYRSSAQFEADREFWAERLAARTTPATLARRRGPGTSAMPLRGTTRVPQESFDQLRETASAASVSWPAVVVAAAAVLVHRVSGETQLVLGFPVAARTGKIARQTPGMAANLVPLCVEVRPDSTLRELLREVAKEIMAVLRRQRYRYEDIRRDLGLAGQGQHLIGPTVNVMSFDYDVQFAGHGASTHRLPNSPVDDLAVYVYDRCDGQGLELGFDANAQWYQPDELLGHQQRFVQLLQALGPGLLDTRIDQLPVDVAAPERVTDVVAAFESTVDNNPTATAIVDRNGSLTYAELDEGANRLAGVLAGRGAGPETVVAVALERSAGLVMALLAVLKTGAAYLVVDPTHPPARLRFVLDDTRPVLVVTAGDLMSSVDCETPELLLDNHDIIVAMFDNAPARISGVHRHRLSAAYLCYTSGSTGRPKPVMVPHGGLAAQLDWLATAHPLDGRDVMLARTAATFDASGWELWHPLLSGAAVCLTHEDLAGDPGALVEFAARHGVTVAQFVPSLLAAVLSSVDESVQWPTLRALFVGGEALPAALAEQAVRRWPVPLVNLYGPTETTIQVSSHSWSGTAGATVPIGTAVTGTELQVLDSRLKPAVVGELYVGGAQLARGYRGDPALTATRFVAGPDGERLYRTGDLVRRDRAGVLEFVGRADEQVKVRGFRIEPAEVQDALLEHPEVSQAAVSARADHLGTLRLIAHLVPVSPGAELDPQAIVDHLSQRLPSYLIPTVFVTVPSFPLTPNGKLDRSALPDPVIASTAGPARAALTPREETVVRLFAEVLGVDVVGPDDDFFTLGGDSILAIQLVGRARRAGLSITPQDVFTQRSAAALALTAVTAQDRSVPDSPSSGILPLPIMHRLRELGGPIDGFNQSMLLRVPAEVQQHHLIDALQAVLDRHDALRMRLNRSGTWTLAVGPVSAANCLTWVSVAGWSAEEVDAKLRRLAEQGRARLNPDAGVLVQAAVVDPVFQHGKQLALVIHHLAVDGVSWRVLLADLAAAWEAAVAGRRPALDPVGTSFGAWSRLLTDQAGSRAAELARWQRMLRRPEPVLGSRPLDPERDVFDRQRSLVVHVHPDQTAALLTTVPAGYRARVHEVLLAALAIAVRSWRADPAPVLVDVEGHGREPGADEADLSRTVGWFTSLFPVALDPGSESLAVRRVKEVLRSLPDNGIGYGVLRYLNSETAGVLAALPAPQISFNYLGRFDTLSGEFGTVVAAADADAPLGHAVQVDAYADGTHLVARWAWPADVLSEPEVSDLAQRWLAALDTLITDAPKPGSAGRSPVDVPLVSLTQRHLERLEADYPGLVDLLPLTPLQEGLLFHSVADEGTPDVYVVQLIVDLTGPVQPDRLRSAARALLDRHPNLRTGFVHSGLDRPVQVVPAELEPPWREVDLSGFAAEQRETEAERVTEAERSARFAPERPPLLRFTLISLGEQRFRLVLTHHHLLSDGWSAPVLLSDLFGLYSVDSLTPAPSFRDYLRWLQRQDRDTAAQAWQAALSGVSPTLVAPADPGRADVASQRLEVTLSQESSATLTAQLRAAGLTPHTAVLGAWGLLLAELTGRDDVVFGTTVSGRAAPVVGIERLVGPLINTVPVRVRLDRDESALGLLTRLQREQAALIQHHHLGLSDIQRAAGQPALFDTATVFENYPADWEAFAEPAPGVRITGVQGRDGTHYPLSLSATLTAGRLSLAFGYRPDLIDPATVPDLAARLVELLEAIAADPHRPAITRDRVAPVAITPESVPVLFERQVARTPDRPAVVCGTVELSYAELNARANQFARFLVERGIGPEDLVALALPRGIDQAVAILGVLKAGAAYLPIDLHHPAERIAFLLDDARPALVIGADLPGTAFPDLTLHSGHDLADADRIAPLLPAHPAYVIHTSGSTGRPKGVIVTHLGLANFAATTAARFEVDEHSRVAQLAPLSFDASVMEWATTWLSGAALVLGTADQALVGLELARFLGAHRVSHLVILPSALALLPVDQVSARLSVLVGGEACPPPVVEQWSAGRRMIAAYGPTEATVAVTTSRPLDANGSGVIGDPLNLTLHVLDELLRPVPVGVAGELYASGIGLARGYLNQPALTAQRFVADPFGGPGERLYRTGDLVRERADGSLEFLGRTDDQVKVLGVRIEPGEIEAALLRHPAVERAVVVAASRKLRAYAITSAPVSPTELRDHLERLLPGPLVPASVVIIDEFPLLPNGKVNRSALSELESTVVAAPRAASAPRDEVLAGLVAEVLDVPSASSHDNFFDLGGDSLRAMVLANRIRSVLRVDVSVRDILRSASVAALADLLSGSDEPRPPLLPAVRPEQPPLSPAQFRLWMANYLGEADGSYNVAFGLRLTGTLDRTALTAALGDLTRRHESLRTIFPDGTDGPFQQVLAADSVLQVADTTAESLSDELSAAVNRGFDLATEVPLRAHLFAINEREHFLLLVLHHIACDGHSMEPLAADLRTAYSARSQGEAPQWTPLPVQYADFALWQRKLLGDPAASGSLASRQLEFWRAALAGAPERLALPFDRPMTRTARHRTEAIAFHCGPDGHHRLRELARQCRASTFMVAHAGLAALLSRSGAGTDLPIATAVAGRGDEALGGLVGCFVNLLVLRTDCAGDPPFRELVHRVRDTNLAAYAHQDVPFELVVKDLNPRRSPAGGPLAQVALVSQNFADLEFTLPGLLARVEPLHSTSAEFPLVVELRETFTADGRPAGLEGLVHYATELFDRATVDSMVTAFTDLLTEAGLDPDLPLTAISANTSTISANSGAMSANSA